jgi:hypothetical protein
MKSELERKPPFGSEWNIVSGQQGLMKSIPALEFRDGAIGLVVVNVLAVNQMLDWSLAANLDRLGE